MYLTVKIMYLWIIFISENLKMLTGLQMQFNYFEIMLKMSKVVEET